MVPMVATNMKPDNPGNSTNDRELNSPDIDPARQSIGFPLRSHITEIRVRYQETDAQGHAHHTTYINYFEIGRIEMLRAAGYSYRDLEDQGILLVISEVGCQFFAPANYDDLLRMKTTVVRAKGARIRHEYEIHRDDELVVRGFTVVAAVDRTGNVLRLPLWLRLGSATNRTGD